MDKSEKAKAKVVNGDVCSIDVISTFAVLRLLSSLRCVLCAPRRSVGPGRSGELMPPSVGGTERGRYGVCDVVESAKDQRVGARMSASQPKTTRGRTR
jgi:hypothetical protein